MPYRVACSSFQKVIEFQPPCYTSMAPTLRGVCPIRRREETKETLYPDRGPKLISRVASTHKLSTFCSRSPLFQIFQRLCIDSTRRFHSRNVTTFSFSAVSDFYRLDQIFPSRVISNFPRLSRVSEELRRDRLRKLSTGQIRLAAEFIAGENRCLRVQQRIL